MPLRETTHAYRVVDAAGRRQAIDVLAATYCHEKAWATDPDALIPPDDLQSPHIAWFVAVVDGRPSGVLRILFAPPLGLYAEYGFKLLDTGINVEEFIRNNRIAEIGRFAVVPEFRSNFMVAATLMRAAVDETLARGFTHFVTDVFEDDPHSPYGFHTRVMGFFPVATHDVGELRSASRRITLVLDLRAAYKRLKKRGNWLFRYLTGRWDEALHQHMVA